MWCLSTERWRTSDGRLTTMFWLLRAALLSSWLFCRYRSMLPLAELAPLRNVDKNANADTVRRHRMFIVLTFVAFKHYVWANSIAMFRNGAGKG